MTMPTDAQVKAVARAIREFDHPEHSDPTYYNAMAHIAIAAFATATRSDAERESGMRPEDDPNTRILIRYGLRDVFVQASSYRSDSPQRELYVAEGIIAVLAALREAGALMPDLPAWVRLVEVDLRDGPPWDEPRPSIIRATSGTGPTIMEAIANALEADE